MILLLNILFLIGSFFQINSCYFTKVAIILEITV